MCRNYRELTDRELAEIEELYPVTPSREIARRYGISLDALQRKTARPRGWKKDPKAVFIGRRNGRTLTEKEERWIIRHYQHTKNDDIMAKFHIGESSLHRLARKHGLKKSRQHMKKTQRNATSHAKEACKRFGMYEDTSQRMRKEAADRKARGERLPGSFMPGVSNLDRLGPKRFRECNEKRSATMREIRRKERLRLHWGLPQLTKLNISYNGYTPAARKRSNHRHLFRVHNYIVERGATVVYYDEMTDRRPRMEANAYKYGLKVREWKDE